MRNSHLLVLGSLLFALLLLGLVSLQGPILALVVPLALYLVAAIWYGPQDIRLKVDRSLSAATTRAGAPVTVQVAVRNEGPDLEEVLIEDEIPPGLELLDGVPDVLASLPSGESVDLEYVVSSARGRYSFEAVEVLASDRFGLLLRSGRLPAPGQLDVTPRVPRLRGAPVRPRQTLAYSGPVPSRQGGPGVEFLGVRGYKPGDPLRWINWKLAARHAHALFTNEFEQERIADVGVILDARRRTNVYSRGTSLFEHAIHAAGSLAEAILRDGNRVGLLIYGRALEWTFPGYGKAQRERILRALAQATTGRSIVFDRLDYVPTRLFPARSQIVLVSPLSREDVPPLLRLRARGYSLLVVSPDPVRFEVKALPAGQATDLAARVARVERSLLLREISRAGVRVIDWDVDCSLEETVHARLGRSAERAPLLARAL